MTLSLVRATARIARALPQGARDSLYRLGPISNAIRSMLTRAVPDEIILVEVAAGPLAGLKMELDLKLEKDLWLGTYEPALLEAIQHWVEPGMITYDVGANIGYVSLALARAVGPKGQVVAFEPLPDNVSRLHSNIELNPEGSRVRVVEAAVGDRTGDTQFLIHRSGAMGKMKASKGRAEAYQDEIRVQVIAVDDWIEDQDEPIPGLIKIDVEGGEALVLAGLERTLKKARPMILVELHGPEAGEKALELLDAAHYRLHGLGASYPELQGLAEWKTYAIALPDDFESQ